MFRFRSIWPISVTIFCLALAGCGGTNQFGTQQQNNGNSSVVIAMTDTPPSTVSVLSAEVTLTGATLAPGNVTLFSGSTTVELTRLQTDIGYIATAANIPAGNYTSLTLTFANPSLTIENDTASDIVSGTTACKVGTICTMAPTATANLSTTFSFLTPFTIALSSSNGLLIDVNLDNLLNATLGADFSAGTTVTSFTPAGTAAPPVGAEDVVGHVASVNASNNTFTLTNAAASFSLKVDGTSTFFQFPTSACSAPGLACLKANQILSVDIGIQGDGSILARNILFEDSDSSDIEVEGEITGTNVASQQFNLVVHSVSASATGLKVGAPVTVQYSSPTTFDVDFLHVDSFQESTSSFSASFTGPADLVAGQEISLRRNSSSSNSTVVADRVRLRSSRVSATVQSDASSVITIGQNSSLPSLFSGHGGVTQILAQTSVTPPTTYFEIGGSINASTNLTNNPVSVRGPLFNTGGTNRTLLATRVVLK
jgi:hypothetical protein